MGTSPTTRPSLLVRIRDPGDQDAWLRFVEVYAPLVYQFARRRGLQDADAADVTQDVFQVVAAAVQRLEYDPGRGSFRGWLFTVARHKLLKFLARRRRHIPGSGDSRTQELLEKQSAPGVDESTLWEQEYEQRLFDWAAEQVRGHFQNSTWQAFWQTVVVGQNPREVADALGMSVGAVYIAKSRVLARLREQIRSLQAE